MRTPENTLNDDQFVLMDCKGLKRPKSSIKTYVIESKTTRAKAEKAIVHLDGTYRIGDRLVDPTAGILGPRSLS